MPKAVLPSVVFLIGIELVDLAGHAQGPARCAPTSSSSPPSSPLTVVVVGVEQGIVARHRARRSSTTCAARTGPPPPCCSPTTGRRVARRRRRARRPHACPGLVVYRFAGSLYYANANLLLRTGQRVRHRRPTRRGGSASTPPPSPTSTTAAARRSASSTASSPSTASSSSSPSPCRPCDVLDRYGLTDLLGADAIYDTVDDAVQRFAELHPASDR